jgi:hypothetical protein
MELTERIVIETCRNFSKRTLVTVGSRQNVTGDSEDGMNLQQLRLCIIEELISPTISSCRHLIFQFNRNYELEFFSAPIILYRLLSRVTGDRMADQS